MSDELDQIISDLDNFLPDSGELSDLHRLYQIFDGFDMLAGREGAMPAMFSLMERYPDADFGAPGALVHELEAMGAYESSLLASLSRRPVYLTVLMANRILNGQPIGAGRDLWLNALRAASGHTQASVDLARMAADFVQRHEGIEGR
jgi:hypothetical protein